MQKKLLATLVAALFVAAASPAFADTDMDGYEPPIDCNDDNPAIHPGATEVVGNEVDENCDGQEVCYVDADSDGYRLTTTTVSTNLSCGEGIEASFTEPTGDCDDTDPGVNPGRFEACDPADKDEDCDGFPDDDDPQQDAIGLALWYPDADDDGYGVSPPVSRCDAPSGHVATDGDCDDTDAGISPGDPEICDAANEDEDCDGEADDLDAQGATGATTWYEDADDDGYGSSSSSLLRCDQPSGYLGNDDDCDDADSSISPADPEICDAANEDEDCDGLADDSDTAVGGTTPWYSDADGDGYGAQGSPPQIFCDAPPLHAGNDGDCDDADAAIRPGGTETCDPGDPDDYNCDGNVACADATCSSAPGCTVEVFDHFECFKIKTSEKLKATLDLDPGTSPPFQLAEGCRIGKASKFCVPVKKTVSVVDASSTLTDNPLYEGPTHDTMNVCYKVKCPSDSPPVAADSTVEVLDRFGAREFTKFKVSELCAPAELVP